ncbi:alpha/beta fold hydrolase [Roseibium alexandrii]|uniref:Putative magnesium chelatase accessory protein n=1 Tax=Roseibium alexandrii TaxID=388408 RepID=A0A0M6ZX58_9HYPH|nr:alpha/beta hydrolase [Roseibium alexandrii]CTQ67358.1 putative magnesium chelatase accessory protein [Roseibium alexandrii]
MTFPTSDAIRNPERTAKLSLQNGRRLAWSEWGPETGQPILFISGAGTAGSLGFGADCLDELNIRLIAPDRPGLGGSDPDPSKTLQSVADDFSEVIRHLGSGPMPVAAVSQGVPFALALAADGPVGRLAVVCGQDELSRPEFFSGLPDQLQQMVRDAKDDPHTLIAMLEGFTDPNSFLEFIISTSTELDQAVYLSEPFHLAFKSALERGFAQGPAGYALDTVAAMGPWTFTWDAITCPVDLWYGGKDASPVHSPDGGALMASRLKHANRHFFEDEGGSLLWTRSRDILTALVGEA